jgi:putative transposase
MSKYLRNYVSGACYFFTFNLQERNNNSILMDNIYVLRSAFKYTKNKYPFQIDAIVILPDHIHLLITLPKDDSDYAKRIKSVKTYFSKQVERREFISDVSRSRKERGIWQRRFWEHTIRDEIDYVNHMNYIHYNPVKHGYVERPKDWQYSSFHKMVSEGLYSLDWGESPSGEFGE